MNKKFKYNKIPSIVKEAKSYAIACHDKQTYGGRPYEYHLQMAYDYAMKYIHLVNEKNNIILAAIWLHDVIEDTFVTYNTLWKKFDYEVADLVLAVTKPNNTRADDKKLKLYYKKIKSVPDATFVKLCDRLANVLYSIQNKSEDKLKMYKKEYPLFKNMLWEEKYEEMFSELDSMLEDANKAEAKIDVDEIKIHSFMKTLDKANYIYMQHLMSIRDVLESIIEKYSLTKEDICRELEISPKKYNDYITGAVNYNMRDLAKINALSTKMKIMNLAENEPIQIINKK